MAEWLPYVQKQHAQQTVEKGKQQGKAETDLKGFCRL